MSERMSVVAVIPAFEKHALTTRCARTLLESAEELALTALIVDDGSREPYRREDFPAGVEVIRTDANRGYIEATNWGVATAIDRFSPGAVLVMNNDLEFRRGAVGRLARAVEDFDIVGPFGRSVAMVDSESAPFVEFSCAMVRTGVFASVGLLDPRFHNGYYSDDDFCLRAHLAGFKLAQIPAGYPAEVIHHTASTHGAQRRQSLLVSRPIFLEKWGTHQHPDVATYIRDYLWDPALRRYGKMAEVERLRREALAARLRQLGAW